MCFAHYVSFDLLVEDMFDRSTLAESYSDLTAHPGRGPLPPSADSSWPALPLAPRAPGIGGLFRYSLTFRQCSSSWSVLGSCGEDTAAGAAEQPPINNHPDKGPETWRGATCPRPQQGEAPAGRTGTAARCARWGCANTHFTGGEAKAPGALSTGQRPDPPDAVVSATV